MFACTIINVRGHSAGLREAWKRTLREHGARLLLLVCRLNGDNREQQEEHWRRLTPGLKGIEWKLPNWPNVFPAVIVREQDQRTLAELAHDEREHLGKFVDSWFVADRNYVEWVKQYPELARDLEDSGRFISVCFQALPDGGVQAVTRIEPPVTERTVYAAAC